MSKIRDTIYVNVEYSDEDQDYGPVYVASCDELALVTDGQTFEELLENLREAITVSLEDTDTITEFSLVPHPQVVILIRLPVVV